MQEWIESMEYFKIMGIKIIDGDLVELMFRFVFNFAIISIIIRWLYYPKTKRQDYLFTYYLIGIVIFLLCIVLRKNDLDTGLAPGLFAIIGIIRYRTNPIPIKEITYLFIIIGIAVINALANKKTSYAELFFANGAIILMALVLEKVWFQRYEIMKTIIYEKIDLIKPESRKALIQDIESRTGIKINRLEVGDVDFLKDTAKIKIFYYDDEQ